MTFLQRAALSRLSGLCGVARLVVAGAVAARVSSCNKSSTVAARGEHSMCPGTQD